MKRKPKYNKKGNMIIETGFKRFDKETNCICRGNIISNTMYGSYIRPYSEVKNGSYIGEVGDFLKYDMKNFKKIPNNIKRILEDKERKESYCLYELFTHPNGRREVFGYILCDKNSKLITSSIICSHGQNYMKRFDALNYVIDMICVEGNTEIPTKVKEYFESLDTLTFVDYYKYDNKEYRLSAYKRVNDISDDVYLDDKGTISIYEITNEISKYTGKPKTELLDIVEVKWNFPPFKLDYKKYWNE